MDVILQLCKGLNEGGILPDHAKGGAAAPDLPGVLQKEISLQQLQLLFPC